jgi:hypothetical protein
MNVLLTAWDTKPEAHQGDVPTSLTDTQNVFSMPRCGRPSVLTPHLHRATADAGTPTNAATSPINSNARQRIPAAERSLGICGVRARLAKGKQCTRGAFGRS